MIEKERTGRRARERDEYGERSKEKKRGKVVGVLLEMELREKVQEEKGERKQGNLSP